MSIIISDIKHPNSSLKLSVNKATMCHANVSTDAGNSIFVKKKRLTINNPRYIVLSMIERIFKLSILFVFFIAVSIFFFPFSTTFSSPIEIENLNGFPPGARSLGLGNTGIALPADPFSSFYNPAAICLLQRGYILFDLRDTKRNSSFTTLPSISGKTIDLISIVHPTGGITWRPLSKAIIEKDTIIFSDVLQETLHVISKLEYRADEIYLTLTTLSGGNLLNLHMKPLFGINLKYYRVNLAESKITKSKTTSIDASSNIDTGNGFGIDFGFAFMKSPILLGLVVKDIFSKVNWSDYESDRISTKIGAGLSASFTERIMLSLDFRYDTGLKKTGLYVGMDSNLYKKKNGSSGGNIRLGFRLDDLNRKEKSIYSFGFGYFFSRFFIDFALYGDKDFFENKNLSSQVSIFIVY